MGTGHPTYLARVVGRVDGRKSALAMVLTAGDAEAVRVRWRTAGSGEGAAGWHCAIHGHLDHPEDCPHVDIAEAAIEQQRAAEKHARTTTRRRTVDA